MKKSELRKLFNDAKRAGEAAASAHTPTPMIVNDARGGKQYFVAAGVCGFASVVIRPGTSQAARYGSKHFGYRKAYYGGVSMSVSQYGQSLETKEAFANAYAEVLSAAGITAYVDSRMD